LKKYFTSSFLVGGREDAAGLAAEAEELLSAALLAKETGWVFRTTADWVW
jgi:hypothetical protein